jgi:hypothetical protein
MQAVKLSILMTTTAVAIAGCAQALELDKPFEVADKAGTADHVGGAGGAPSSSENIDPCSLEPLRSCYPGPDATVDVGICKLGMQTCINGTFGPCEGAIIPTAETCNGLDDDCDGMIDNPNVVDGQPCETGHSGVCQTGTTSCLSGSLQCNAMITPGSQVEVCDDLVDNDCNGQVDGCTCTPQTQMDCEFCSYSCLFESPDLRTTVLEPKETSSGISEKEDMVTVISPSVLDALCCARLSGVKVCLPDGSAWGPCAPL